MSPGTSRRPVSPWRVGYITHLPAKPTCNRNPREELLTLSFTWWHDCLDWRIGTPDLMYKSTRLISPQVLTVSHLVVFSSCSPFIVRLSRSGREVIISFALLFEFLMFPLQLLLRAQFFTVFLSAPSGHSSYHYEISFSLFVSLSFRSFVHRLVPYIIFLRGQAPRGP